ncbi:MAG: hypothetical protein QNJ97_20805 [Myxococcota bacterium]|nr:hypothetical protein [Myxococcota bacterium]
MMQPVFDAASFVAFDLGRGTIHSAGSEQLALVPIDVLTALEPGEHVNAAARAWGGNHGRRLSASQGDALQNIGMDVLAEHLCGTMAALGLGSLSIEIHHSALMFRLRSNSEVPFPEAGDALRSGFLAGYLKSLGQYGFEVIPLVRQGDETLFWAGNPEAVPRVRQWIEEGVDPITAVRRLCERSDKC